MNISEMTTAQQINFWEKWENAGSEYTEGDNLQDAFEAALYAEPEMDTATEREAYLSFAKGWFRVRGQKTDLHLVVVAGLTRLGFTFLHALGLDHVVNFLHFKTGTGEDARLTRND